MNLGSRVAEVRLIVIVTVTLSDPELIEALAASGGQPVANIVKSEIVSNLESVSYVAAVIASPL